ncbi:MAG TPA: crosslink repair DNA glycosylase YcaQ family protein [Solirubrobacteraceae bacterium]
MRRSSPGGRPAVSLAQALAWRFERHFLRGGAGSAAEVVRRLSAVPAVSGDADLAIRSRLADPVAGAVAAALASGELISTYAFRGATHLLAAEDASAFMAVRGASAQWARPSWQRYYDLGPDDWTALLETARAVVADGPVARSDFLEAITVQPRFEHLREALWDRSHTLLKPLAWQGAICFGPTIDGQSSYASPASSPRWQGLPDVDAAGRRAVRLYLAGYGPATKDHLSYWLVAGLSAGRRRLDRWIDDLAGEIAEVSVDGRPALHLREHVEALGRVEVAPEELALLPGYDQWVLGPGTADDHVVPAEHRPAITRGANLLLRGGRVAGTWRIGPDGLGVSWFPREARGAPADLEAAGRRLLGLLGREPTTPITELPGTG